MSLCSFSLVCALFLAGSSVSLAQEAVSLDPMKSGRPEADYRAKLEPAPVDGVHDFAELFPTEVKQPLIAKILEYRQREKFTIYLVTYLYLAGDESAQNRADRLQPKWLGDKPGAVIVYSQGSTGTDSPLGMTCQQDPECALPKTTVLGLMNSARAAAFASSEAKPAERLVAATTELMSGYARVRPIIEEHHRQLRIVQYKIVGGVLAFMFASLGILSWTQRFQKKLAIKDAEAYLFPHADIAARYGAPYGGGVVVQMHYGAAAPAALPPPS